MIDIYIKNFFACFLTSLFLALLALILSGTFAAAACFIFGIIINIIVFYNSHRIIDALYSPIIVSPSSAKELYILLAELAKNAEISLPILYASSSPQPNICVVSHKKNHKIIISKNVIQLLDRTELHAMLAHQVAHIASNSIKHKTYIACIASLPAFFFYLGTFFSAFGGKPHHKPPAWARFLFKPASWFSHFIAFSCQSKKNIILIDTLAISIGASVNGYFKGLSKISTASERIRDSKAILFPALSPLYVAPPLAFKRLHIGIPIATRLSRLKNTLEVSGLLSPSKISSKRTSSPSRSGKPKKRPGVASGPSRSQPNR